MLGDISLATNIYLVTGYTDMRKSIDGLCAIIMKNEKTEIFSKFQFCIFLLYLNQICTFSFQD